MNQPQRKIKLEIGTNVYEIEYPNIGQEIDIESRKAILSNGQYHLMQKMKTIAMTRVLDTIDMFSMFSVLIPEFEKDARGVKNIMEIDYAKMIPYVEVYMNTFLPWYISWQKFLNGIKEEKEDKEQ